MYSKFTSDYGTISLTVVIKRQACAKVEIILLMLIILMPFMSK